MLFLEFLPIGDPFSYQRRINYKANQGKNYELHKNKN